MKIPKPAEKFGEAWLSCLLVMVQGDISALTLKHAYVAGKTGLIMVLAYCMASKFSTKQTVYLDVLLTGVLTALADVITHPTHFGGATAEAIVTGITASILALVLHIFVRR